MSLFVYLDQSSGLGFLDDSSNIDITSQVISVSTRRGRNRILSAYEAGTAVITLRDDNGDFNPANTSSPYYPLLPMNKIRVALNNKQTGVFTGYITNFTVESARGVDDFNKVIITCHDFMRVLAVTQITTVTGAGTVQNTGTRIDKLLDTIGFPSGIEYREINVGDFDCQADPGTARNLLDAIKTVTDTENGNFYIDAEGRAVFKKMGGGASVFPPLKTWADSTVLAFPPDLYSAIGFSDAKVAFDDELVFNDITVQRSGGTAQNASDAASITKYSRRTASRTGTLNTTDADALYIAKVLLTTLKDSETRITEVLFPYHGLAPANQSTLRFTELFNRVIVNKKLSGNTTVEDAYLVTGINWDINRETYFVRYMLQEPIVRLFVLNSTTNGVLDYNSLGK